MLSRTTLAPMLVAMLGAISLPIADAQGPPGGPMRGGPGGRGLAANLAPRLLAAVDTDKDGRISPDEAGAAAELFVRAADTARKGWVDAAALGVTLNAKIGRPGGPGGPPPGGPGGFGGPGGPPPDGPGGPPPDGPGGPPDGPGGFGGPPPGGPGGPEGGPGSLLATQILQAADLNKDGHVTPTEAVDAAEQFVRDADTAKRGTIGVDELRAALEKRLPRPGGPGGPGGFGGPPGGLNPGSSLAPKVFQAADGKDGRLTPDELASAAARFVRDEDKENEGAIDFETLYRAINRRAGNNAPLGLGTPDYPARGHGPGDMQAMGLMELADTDKDGRLSPDEAASAAAKLVRDADTAHAGSIDLATFRAAVGRLFGNPFGPGGPPGGPGGPPSDDGPRP